MQHERSGSPGLQRKFIAALAWKLISQPASAGTCGIFRRQAKSRWCCVKRMPNEPGWIRRMAADCMAPAASQTLHSEGILRSCLVEHLTTDPKVGDRRSAMSSSA